MFLFSNVLSWSLVLAANSAFAGLCPKWGSPAELGQLPKESVPEASGMAASRLVPGRVYWINDSGDEGYLYFSELSGRGMKKVRIQNLKPHDTEALALTDCPEGPCVVIGDIGDNGSSRKSVVVTFVTEQKDFKETVSPSRKVRLRYPDGAHDAEAMAFLPNGDLWIVTKEIETKKLRAHSAGVYSLDKSRWLNAGGETIDLKKEGELPLPRWLSEDLFFAQGATDMAMDPARRVLGILTYGRAVEIPLERLPQIARSGEWKEGQDFAIVPLKALAQQESLLYLNSPDRILWSTERRLTEAPIFSMTCARAAP